MNAPATPLPPAGLPPTPAAKVPAAGAAPVAPVQRIIKVRRDYNSWVASETMEDYALRKATLMFNGYEAQVGQLYAGMDLKKNF